MSIMQHRQVGLPKYKHNDITVDAMGGRDIASGTYLRSVTPGYGIAIHALSYLVLAYETHGWLPYEGKVYVGGFA